MSRATSPAAPEYAAFIANLQARIQTARLSAARAVNRELILLYWDIGRGIVEKQRLHGWGEAVVETVAKDLREAFPEMRGFSANNVWLMRQFYSEYSEPSFLEQLVQERELSRRVILQQPVAEIPQPEPVAGGSRVRILEQLVQELLPAVPWGHHVEIVKKVKAPASGSCSMPISPASMACRPSG